MKINFERSHFLGYIEMGKLFFPKDFFLFRSKNVSLSLINFNRMRNFLLLSITFIFISVSFAQSSWKLEDYSKWNHTNFRQNQNFNRPFSITNPDYLLLDAAIFYMTNEERSKVGVTPMRYHKLLEVAAYNHSFKMATTGFFSHQNSVDGSRYSTSDRGQLAGVSNPSFAENIAYNYPDNGNSYLQVATKLIVQWMNSAGHKENILSPKGRQMAAGTYYYNGKIYGTQVFQWFSDVIENPNGGKDQLPKLTSSSERNVNPTTDYPTNSTTSTLNETSTNSQITANNNTQQYELNELKNKVSKLNKDISEQEKTIAQLTRENTALKNSTTLLQQQKNEKEAQYNKINSAYQTLSDRRTSVRKSKYNADDFHPFTMKIGLHTFYQSISDLKFEPFDESLLSIGTEAMIGFNFGESYRRNSIGITMRASQANRMLTQSLDSSAEQPLQFYDAELTTIFREWLSFGVGANLKTSYGSSTFQVNPSMSLGFCFGPKNWKIQLTQQATMNSDLKIYGRASIGLSFRL